MYYLKRIELPNGRIIESVERVDGEVSVSMGLDHPEYLAWLAEGNAPEPWEAPNAD
jgi:hypothetical protein